MTLDEFKTSTQAQRDAYGKSLPLGGTYDSKGNELTFKEPTWRWIESTYDDNGNKLTYKSSTGYFNKLSYDSNGNVMLYENGWAQQ